MLKKFGLVLTALLLSSALVFTGCGGDPPPGGDDELIVPLSNVASWNSTSGNNTDGFVLNAQGSTGIEITLPTGYKSFAKVGIELNVKPATGSAKWTVRGDATGTPLALLEDSGLGHIKAGEQYPQDGSEITKTFVYATSGFPSDKIFIISNGDASNIGNFKVLQVRFYD